MKELGTLDRITDIRSIWPGEADHFTPWLAQPENLSLLSQSMGYGRDGLELEAVEANVGAFRADILARDTNSPAGERVLIENQFGRSDHDHLGKLITYASGLDAHTVLLISEEIREEHRSAIDWLNRITSDAHRFFAVKVELWRIGESLPAPRFEVVVQPNGWARAIDSAARLVADGLTDLRQTYLRYWTALGELMTDQPTNLRPRKAAPQQWTGFGIGRTGCELNASVNSQEKWIRAELALGGPEGKGYFWLLQQDREDIQGEAPFELQWDELPGRLQSRVFVRLDDADPANEDDWPRQHAWLADKLSALNDIFRPRIANIDRDTVKLL
ncbi:MAG: DUF4268 domain-containing protein [Pseudomonadota bacterium]